jgi:hypothetical protein
VFTRKLERRVYIAVATLLFAVMLGVSFGVYVLWPSRREVGYMPRQPILYNHALHAGEMEMECVYCHTEAERGPHATVPPLSTCMKCHTEVQTKQADGSLEEETAKLIRHWESKEPVRWKKVNVVADFVYFDHSQHVLGDVECQECHGPVETYEHMKRFNGLKMAWCVDCHEEPLPDDDPKRLLGQTTTAPIHCSTCHR